MKTHQVDKEKARHDYSLTELSLPLIHALIFAKSYTRLHPDLSSVK